MSKRVLSISFASAVESDFDRLADLRVAAMRESLERVGRFDPDRARERLRSTFSPGHTRIILFEENTVGFYAALPSSEGLHLDHLYIHPDFQGRGIGGLALRKIFEEADRDVPILVGALKESASNRFYQRYGFEKTGENEWDIYYVRPPSTKETEASPFARTAEASPGYSLRPACSADVPFFVAMRETTMGPIVRRHLPWIPEEQEARVLYRYDCAKVITLGAQDIGLWKVASDPDLTDLIQVQLLPDFQRLGIGSHLIVRLQDDCRLAMRPITLHVFASNPALRLYQRLGFEVTEEDEHSFQMMWRPTAL